MDYSTFVTKWVYTKPTSVAPS